MKASVHKILFTGPESTAKTSLARELSMTCQTLWVPEYARFYLTRLQKNYEEEDLLSIAKGQLQWEQHWEKQARQFLFCDTSMLVMKIWSEYKYQRVHPWIAEQWEKSNYTIYFLCKPDLPWSPDPLRENEKLEEREWLFEQYKNALEEAGKHFIVIGGTWQERFQTAKSALNNLCHSELQDYS